MGIGFLRLGTYIRLIPHPVTVGFTAGIAVIILASQVKDLLGLRLAGAEPGPFVEKVSALWEALPTAQPASIGMALLTLAVIVGLKRWRPGWPGMLVAAAVASAIAAVLELPVETIESRFGSMPRSLPWPSLPAFTLEKTVAVLPDAVAFALLGSIEALLSAVVADGMTGRRHRSNCELVAQGVANLATSVFGGMVATGTIARTATNVRAGARSPIAGMLHSLFLLLFLLVAAPLAGYVPLATLAGILVFVAWNMAEKGEFVTLLRVSRGDALVLLATFLLTLFRDLTTGILVGFALGAVLFIERMAEVLKVEGADGLVPTDRADNGAERPYDSTLAVDPDTIVYRISGAFFFGAASTVAAALDRIADQPKTFVLDFSAVPFLDSTAANTILAAQRKAQSHDVQLWLTGASPSVRKTLLAHGLRPPAVRYARSIEQAVARVGTAAAA
jgi:SulP family sulfate permease